MAVRKNFWSRVNKSDGCWEWTGPTNGNGYGRHGKEYAHGLSWKMHFGDIPDGLLVCHKCDNKPCVRPNHLFVGTYTDNIRDCVSKGRHVSGLPENPIGENAYRAKLTQQQVERIRILRASGLSGMKIAEMFPQVRYQQIYRILSGEKWKQEGETRWP